MILDKDLLYKFPRSFATTFSAKKFKLPKDQWSSKKLLSYISPNYLYNASQSQGIHIQL